MVWCFFSFSSANAEIISLKSKVASLHEGLTLAEDTLVFLENDGVVLHVSPLQKDFLNSLKLALKSNDLLELSWNSEPQKSDFLLSLKTLKTTRKPITSLEESFRFESLSSLPEYSPTRFSSKEDINHLFESFREKMKQDSQCYQRAHTWAYEAYNAYNVKSMKVFIFFTDRYIREYHYKWWFHVAPFTYLQNEEFVLDRTFADTPLKTQEWTNIFMEGNWICPSVARYSDYREHQQDQYCFLRKVPMYYFQPLNVEAMDKDVGVDHFIDWEVKLALKARKCGLFGCN